MTSKSRLQLPNSLYFRKLGSHWQFFKKQDRQSPRNTKVGRNLFKLNDKKQIWLWADFLFQFIVMNLKIAMFHIMTFGSMPFFLLVIFHQILFWCLALSIGIYSASFNFLLCPVFLSIVHLENRFSGSCTIAFLFLKSGLKLGYWCQIVLIDPCLFLFWTKH